MTTDGLARTPEHDKALREFDHLLSELPLLEEEKSQLVGHQVPMLHAIYLSKIGDLRIQLLQLQHDCFALRRKMEMIRSARTRGVPVMIEVITTLVESEMKEYREKIEQEIKEIEKAAKAIQVDPLSEDDSKELKKLYHRLAKMLHPDLHPEQDPSRISLWLGAVAAYEAGDLARMRVICILAENGGVAESTPSFSTLQELVMRNNYLRMVVERLREEIGKIRDSFPCTVQDQIDDQEWVNGQRAAILQLMDSVKVESDYYNQQIELLMKEDGI